MAIYEWFIGLRIYGMNAGMWLGIILGTIALILFVFVCLIMEKTDEEKD